MIETVEALYDFTPQRPGDLPLYRGTRIEVQEHMSSDWLKGKNMQTGDVGIFPANYVKSVPAEEKKEFGRAPAPPPPSHYGQNGSGDSSDYPEPFSTDRRYQPPPATWVAKHFQAPGKEGVDAKPTDTKSSDAQKQTTQEPLSERPAQPLPQDYGAPQEPPPAYSETPQSSTGDSQDSPYSHYYPPSEEQQNQYFQQQNQENPHRRGHPHIKAFADGFVKNIGPTGFGGWGFGFGPPRLW